MDFTYEASGGIRIFGCSFYNFEKTKIYLFTIGSILYSKPKAMIGVYEKVAVKDVRFPKDFVNLYVDTFNALWNEDELVSYQTATNLIAQYIERRNALAEENVSLCKS